MTTLVANRSGENPVLESKTVAIKYSSTGVFNYNDLRADQFVAIAETEDNGSGGGGGALPPIGYVYVRFPQTDAPDTLWPGTTWTELDFGGAFFRAAGTCACGFNCGLQTHATNATGITASTSCSGAHGHTINYDNTSYCPGWYCFNGTISGVFSGRCIITRCGNCTSLRCINTTGTHTHPVSFTGSCETRPKNFTIKIYKRTA